MRYVRVEKGVVVNATIFDGEKPKGWDAPNVWLQSDVAQIGWGFDNGGFLSPPPVENSAITAPPPVTVDRLAALEAALIAKGVITGEQVDAALEAAPDEKAA